VEKGKGRHERFSDDKKVNLNVKNHINNPEFQNNNYNANSLQTIYKCPAESNCPYEA
jgi:hypothetical protein